jgi:hypothetical protein
MFGKKDKMSSEEIRKQIFTAAKTVFESSQGDFHVRGFYNDDETREIDILI